MPSCRSCLFNSSLLTSIASRIRKYYQRRRILAKVSNGLNWLEISLEVFSRAVSIVVHGNCELWRL